jgi:hypothetical protein
VRHLRRFSIIAAVLALGILVGSVGASAVFTSRTGTFTERQYFLTESAAWTTGSGAFGAVPNSFQSVTVPAGQIRIIKVTFTAESQCLGPGNSGWCSVRAVYVTPAGALVEMNPVAGFDFAFDSGDSNAAQSWESHAIERSSWRLGAGTYRVFLQAAVVAGATQLRLDDRHESVEVVRA